MNSAQVRRVIFWTMVLLIWEAAFRIFHWPDWIFPAPSHIFIAFQSMLTEGAGSIFQRPLIQANLVSALRLVMGFAISVSIGAFFGAVMWRWREMDQLLGPLFLGLQTLPSVCWVPLAIILFGLTEQGILFVLVMGSFSGVAISLRDGLRTIPPLYQRAGMMLGARGWRMYRYVLLPASLPALAGSLRQGFSFAWRSLMGAEVIFAVDRHGLGFVLHIGRELNEVGWVVVAMAVMVIIGITADRFVFSELEKV